MGRHRVIGGSPPILLDFQQVSFTDTGPHTHASIAFGAASANRTIIVAVGAVASATPLTCTIAGNAATRIAGGGTDNAQIFALAVPSGTSGTIDFDPDAGWGRLQMGVWAAYNVKSITAIDTSALASDTLTSKPRGAVLAVGYALVPMAEAPGAFSATGLTIDAQPTFLTSLRGRALFASSLTSAITHAYSITPPANTVGAAAYAAVSLR